MIHDIFIDFRIVDRIRQTNPHLHTIVSFQLNEFVAILSKFGKFLRENDDTGVYWATEVWVLFENSSISIWAWPWSIIHMIEAQ